MKIYFLTHNWYDVPIIGNSHHVPETWWNACKLRNHLFPKKSRFLTKAQSNEDLFYAVLTGKRISRGYSIVSDGDNERKGL